MDNRLAGTILKTEIARKALPDSSTYTITVDTIKGNRSEPIQNVWDNIQ